jgi:hypothetical protein
MKKKLIFLLSVLILITIALTGCNWLPGGLINVFDPEAQLRVSYSDITGDTISLEVYSLNKVGFNGEGFSCKYYSNDILIPDLMKTVGTPFRVEPSDTSGTPGPITTIDLLLYSQKVQDYMTSNPSAEMTCTISLIGTDEAGHDISKSVTVSLPTLPETEPEPSPLPEPETPDKTPKVEYKISGTATSVSVTLSNSTGGTEQYSNVILPKVYSYSNFDGNFLYISAQNNGDSGTVDVECYYEGVLKDSAHSEGAYVIATASYYISDWD